MFNYFGYSRSIEKSSEENTEAQRGMKAIIRKIEERNDRSHRGLSSYKY